MSKFAMRSYINNNNNNNILNISKGLPNFKGYHNTITTLIKDIDEYKEKLKNTINIIETDINEMEKYKNNLLLQKNKIETLEENVTNINDKNIVKKKINNTDSLFKNENDINNNKINDNDNDEFNTENLEEQVKKIMEKLNIQHNYTKPSEETNKKKHTSTYPIEGFDLDKNNILPIIKNDINNKI
jgi:hypothetical protein